MKIKILKTFSIFSITALLAATTFAKGDCYEIVSLEKPKEYTIQFTKALKLNPVKGNDNWYSQVQADRAFGCVIFAVPQVDGQLLGAFKAVSAEKLLSKCEGKQDYAYTQFVDAGGKRAFRLQCEYPVYEDQLPQVFAPTYQQATKIRFEKSGPRTTKISQ